jgi:hypothetical protein
VAEICSEAGVLLRHLVELLDRLVDLDRADILFAAGGADLGDQFGGAANVGHQRVSISPAWVAAATVSDDMPLISAAAVWLRSASLRTSAATTAKPRHVRPRAPPRPPR